MRPALLALQQQAEEGHWQLVFRQPQVNGRFLNLQPSTNCTQSLLGNQVGQLVLETTYSLECGSKGLREISIDGLERTLVDVMVRVHKSQGQADHYIVRPDNPTLLLSSQPQAVPIYLRLGIEHLLFGIDHLLFVLLLLFVVQGWLNLIKVVTSFTLAHSITLGLSALNLVVLPQRPVEALIALSIAILAKEVIRPSDSIIQTKPWVMTFLFGLLHGFGFAGALKDIGLPENSVVLALLFFNSGVEIGQLIIIGLAAIFLLMFRRSGFRPPRIVLYAPVYVAGGIGVYWFIERIASLF